MKEQLQQLKKELKQLIRANGKKSFEVAYIYAYMGFIYMQALNHSKAIEHNNKALEIFKILPQSHEVLQGLITIYSNFAMIYMELKKYEKAKDYLFQSISLSEAINDIYAEDYSNLIVCYLHLKEFNKAEEYVKKDLKRILQRPNNQEALLTNLSNFMSILIERQDFNAFREHIPILENLLIPTSNTLKVVLK